MSMMSTGSWRTRQFGWEPKEDITTFELARAVPVFFVSASGADIGPLFDGLPPEVRRHFREV